MTHYKDKFVNSILEYPRAYLSIIAVLFLSSLVLFKDFQSTFSNRMWLTKDHQIMKDLDLYESQFGSSFVIVIGISKESSLLNHQDLEKVRKIEEKVELVKGVLRIESFAKSSSITSLDDEINIETFETYFDNPSKLKKRILEEYEDVDNFISKDGSFIGMVAYLIPELNQKLDHFEIYANFKKIKSEFEGEDLRIDLMGSLAANQNFAEVAIRDNEVMIPISALLIAFFLILIFRNFFALSLPIILAIVSITFTFSFMCFLGLKYNNMLAALPGILLAICLADSIHVISSFYLEKTKLSSIEALRKALKINFLPTFLTSVSTMISFLSIANTSIVPVRDLGVLVSFGTGLAWILTYCFIGALLAIFHERMPALKKSKMSSYIDDIDGESFINWIDKWKVLICFTFFALFSTSIFLSSKLKVDSDPVSYFSEDTPIRQSSELLSQKLGYERSVELIIDSGQSEGITKSEFLRKQENLTNWIRELDVVHNVKSLNNIVIKMNEVVDNKSEIPSNQKTLSELLFLFELSSPSEGGLGQFTDGLKRYSRVQISWNLTNVSDSKKYMDQILLEGERRGLKLYPGGEFPIFIQINMGIVKTLISSMLMALCLVFLLILFVFKDLKISLLAMLPNLIPLSFAGLLVYVSGLFLDIGTSMIATITLGIAIDDTIHFVTKYQTGLKESLGVRGSLIYTIENCAGALIQTTIVLFFGFGIFYFAAFLPNKNFGVLTSVCILLALVTDLFLLPAILLIFDKK